jgi:hypothetical protein
MDDKELIKKIMEEVKDEKLREELLGLVVEKNKKEDNTKEDATKQEKEKPIDYVAKQEILLGATEGVAKVEWWIGYIISIILILVGSLGPLGLLGYILAPDEKMERNAQAGIIFLSALFIIGLGMFFSLRSGKKEYEKLKRKSAN